MFIALPLLQPSRKSASRSISASVREGFSGKVLMGAKAQVVLIPSTNIVRRHVIFQGRALLHHLANRAHPAHALPAPPRSPTRRPAPPAHRRTALQFPRTPRPSRTAHLASHVSCVHTPTRPLDIRCVAGASWKKRLRHPLLLSEPRAPPASVCSFQVHSYGVSSELSGIHGPSRTVKPEDFLNPVGIRLCASGVVIMVSLLGSNVT